MASRRRKTARGVDVERQVEYLRCLLQRAESRRRAGGRDSAQTLRVQIGYQFEKVGQWSRAVREYGRALLSAKGRRGPRAAQMLASLRHRIGALAARRGHPKQAIALLAAGRRGLKRALRRWPDEDDLVRRFGDIVLLLAEVRAARDAHAATRTLGSLVRDLDGFVLRNPGSLAGQRQLADACAALADSWEDRHWGEEDRVNPLRKRAASIYSTLMDIAPDDGVREALSRVLTDLGHDAVIRSEARKAQRLLEEALRLLLAMGRLDLALEDEPLRLAGLYSWLGYALARRGDIDGARSAQLTSWAAVEAAARRGVKGGRRRREWAELFADSCTESCLELLKLGAADRPWEAPALLRRAHGFLKTLAERRIIAPGSAREHGRWLDQQAADL